MKALVKNEKLVATIATVLFFVSIIGTTYYYDKSKKLNKGIQEEQLKNELALSEKLSLEKEIANMKLDLLFWKGKNESLDKDIITLNQKLTQKENELKNITWEKGQVKKLNKQLTEIKNAKNDLTTEMNLLLSKISKFEKENNDLNLLVSSLQAKNKELTDNIALLSSVRSDNLCVETQKKNEKLTIFARRTKKINLSFDLPQEVVANIKFRVTLPDGKTVTEEKDGLTYIVEESEPVYTASANYVADELKVSKRIQMSYQPKDKLKTGVYKVELYNNETYIGTYQVKLR